MLLVQRLAEEELSFFDAERAAPGDASYFPVDWVLRVWRLIGHRAA